MPRLVLLCLVVAASRAAQAQRAQDTRAGVAPRAFDSLITTPWPRLVETRSPQPRDRAGPYAPLASALIPGGGQYLLGQDRFVVYAAVEALVWWQYGKHAREQVQQERAFKDIARQVARAHFSTAAPDGPWSYYEAMRDWTESGAFSTADSGPIVPETDTTTYNGHLWQLALQTHSSAADALLQYERDAIKPDFQWSWRNAAVERDVFAQLTNKRNDAFRAAQQDLMIIVANHLLSMVDAFATFRLQIRPDSHGGGSLGASLSW